MPSLKTNYIRTDITSQCFRYEFQLISNEEVDSKYFHEIQGYFLSLNQLIVWSYPFVYSVDEMKDIKTFNFMLSNGQKVQVTLLPNNTITLNSKQVSTEIHKQLMKGTKFLYSQNLQICLNPFQQKKLNYSTSVMPGFSLVTEIMNDNTGFYLIPLEARITEFHSLSALHEHSIILDYNSGSFHKKSAIVRYDKVNQILHFRTGEQLNKNTLKSLEILPLNGFELALKLNNYFKRLKQVQVQAKFISKWQIMFDSRFMELPYNFFPVSHIISRNNQQKSLGEAIGSISAYNFQFNFRKIFSNLTFDDQIRANIYFLVPQVYQSQQKQEVMQVQIDEIKQFYSLVSQEQQQCLFPMLTQFQNLKNKMGLEQLRIQLFTYNIYPGWANGTKKTLRQVQEFVQKQKQKDSADKVFIVTNIEQMLREQKQAQLGSKFVLQKQDTQIIYKKLINFLISQGVYYHLIDIKQNQFKNANDIIAIKSLATIYSKLRLNPWKIKDIPFGTKPLMVLSVHVKVQTNGSVYVSVVGSLNAFLSKYTSAVSKCGSKELNSTLLRLIKQCLQKFKSIHRIYPMRAMIFRTGDLVSSCQEQLRQLQSVLPTTYSCKPSIILLSCETPLRVYNQIDLNYISRETVKPTQLLCQIKQNNERYIQLQMLKPLYRVKILGADQTDPFFEQKIIQLTTKLCFTYQIMTELKFGKGLGFIGYSQKLYNWTKQYNTQIENEQQSSNISSYLKEGLLLFL